MPDIRKQVREFFVFGKQLHGNLKELYVELNEQAQLTQVKILLDLLCRHEEDIMKWLDNFEKKSKPSILEASLEHPSDLDVNKVMSNIHYYDDPTCDEILNIARDFTDALTKLYQEVSEKEEDVNVKTVFNTLVEFEVQANKHMRQELLYLMK